MLYNNHHAQLLLPSGPVPATDSAVTARSEGSQFVGIRLLHLQLHLLLCATRQLFSLLPALGGPRRAEGSAEWPIARLQQWWRKGCRDDSRFAFASQAALSRGSGGAAKTALGGQ